MSAPASPQTYERLRRAAYATALVFFVSGAMFATWVSRLPAIRNALDVTPGQLGLALLAPGVGSLVAMPATGPLCRRFGSRAVVAATALPATLALCLLGLASTLVSLALVLLAWGMLFGSWDVAMNVQGSEVERRAERQWMPRYHACWSVGGVTGAGLGALAAAIGLSVEAHFVIVAVLSAVLLLGALRVFVDDREQRPVTGQAMQSEALLTPTRDPARARLLDARLVLIGLLTLCATCTEGAAADWIAIFLNDDRGATQASAAAGYAVFATAMALGRFAGTSVLERWGRVPVVRLGGAVVVAGVALTLSAPALAGSWAGAALWGLGVSLVFPAAMSAGGETPGRSAEAIAAVSTIGYGGFLIGPPLIGQLADRAGLGTSLWVVAVLGAGIVLLAGAVRVVGPPPRVPLATAAEG